MKKQCEKLNWYQTKQWTDSRSFYCRMKGPIFCSDSCSWAGGYEMRQMCAPYWKGKKTHFSNLGSINEKQSNYWSRLEWNCHWQKPSSFGVLRGFKADWRYWYSYRILRQKDFLEIAIMPFYFWKITSNSLNFFIMQLKSFFF